MSGGPVGAVDLFSVCGSIGRGGGLLMGVWDWEGSRRCWEGGRDSGNGHGNEKLAAAVAVLVPIVADGGRASSRQHRRQSRT
jgi:hypothetical protein